ncbi:MAG: hypothetical protein AMK69_00790 [Nitrospira bacterium SG8_3]|nr:MAG: hypothetical protein AMK69_00790 [Nitrospira bacterium SG8_3]
MTADDLGFVVLLIIGFGIALILYALIHKSLRALLDELVKLPAGTTFYARLLFVGLVLAAASELMEQSFALKEDARFMEYVWKVADGLSDAFGFICVVLLVFIVQITILLAALRRRDE